MNFSTSPQMFTTASSVKLKPKTTKRRQGPGGDILGVGYQCGDVPFELRLPSLIPPLDSACTSDRSKEP